MGIQLPIKLPTALDEYKIGIQLPIKVPFRISRIKKDDIYYQEKLKISSIPQESIGNKVFLRISERPSGAPNFLPISETVWAFPGLIVSENVVSARKNQLLIDEKIYSQIIASFELISPTQLKVSWTGSRVPRVQVYIKSLESENYTLYNTYAWNRGNVIITLQNQNYYIRLIGINDSGSSETYLINTPLEIGIQPELNMVNSIDKIYNINVPYTSEYKIEVEY